MRGGFGNCLIYMPVLQLRAIKELRLCLQRSGRQSAHRATVPRFLGGMFAMPLLATVFTLIGIYGTQLVGVQIVAVDASGFWSQMRARVSLADVKEAIAKKAVFLVSLAV